MKSGWQPSLMKDSDDDNATSPRFIEDDVFAPLETTKTGSERIASVPNAWFLSKEVKSIRKKTQIAFSLFFSPRVYRVQKNIGEIRSGFQGELVRAQALCRLRI
jgi:hypothetical protein